MDGIDGGEAEDFGNAIAVSTGPMVNKSHVPAKNNRDGPTCGLQVRAVIDTSGRASGQCLGRANCMRIITTSREMRLTGGR